MLGGVAWIHFHSDLLIAGRGFHSTFEFVMTANSTDTAAHDEHAGCFFSFLHEPDGFILGTTLADFYDAVGLRDDQPLECIFQVTAIEHIESYRLYADSSAKVVTSRHLRRTL